MEIDRIIGNTPMIKIKYKYNNEIKNLYAKLEYYNYSGSIKDRIANYIIKNNMENGNLKKGQAIVEATSGNTGISFAALGAYYGFEVHIFMPDWVSQERIKIMNLYNAHVHLVSKAEGGFLEAIKRANELATKIDGFRPDQFNNYDNVMVHYLTTGLEISNKLDKVDAFVSGIGTGGTLMGIGKRLKEDIKNIKVIALEPDSLPTLSTGTTIGSHKIEGIGDEFIPSLVEKSMIDEIIQVNDMDAINMSKLLSKRLGLGVGISSGANFIAAIKSQYKNVVTIFADDNKKYLSTDLGKKISTNKNYISENVELINLEVV